MPRVPEGPEPEDVCGCSPTVDKKDELDRTTFPDELAVVVRSDDPAIVRGSGTQPQQRNSQRTQTQRRGDEVGPTSEVSADGAPVSAADGDHEHDADELASSIPPPRDAPRWGVSPRPYFPNHSQSLMSPASGVESRGDADTTGTAGGPVSQSTRSGRTPHEMALLSMRCAVEIHSMSTFFTKAFVLYGT